MAMVDGEQLALGDMIVLPDGRTLSLRSMASLSEPVGSMSGFWLLGELEVLAATPPSHDQPLNIYLPVQKFPVSEDRVITAVEGVARYWAPHLPAIGGAAGEIRFRVMSVRGSVDPIVTIHRGPDTTVFVRTSFAWGSQLDVLQMNRDPSAERSVDRFSAELQPRPLNIEVPAPSLYETFTSAHR